ncbi:ADP-ribosylglycohydrolase family protein [Rhizobium leguminosarum]|jgi:ADP-ribosylglycohydrolase|uniref:ADP-ribosylglycohydrolase family protein n=1 Tax=Rhizobium leguminosarum TaxID=384 RepID=UPI00048EFADE|nr:ADP-ribosylglycohydrolase family protein [Rhizobium leguminosarum]MBY5918035.1 ADP-ribosylglycohydrolase family protein [Rhizobium leguminosarum]TBE55441.1 ADP-ribosylglycohydrolase family protein [Rhizobium leguminosarum]TBE93014.1 ADP-ribosylglycohydrolase family protein [Rhizobium leguminosarum]TBZ97990.1 ADP-ribosylglycohydrolase family protein [Rhizobium leguminosarum bv. viciae]
MKIIDNTTTSRAIGCILGQLAGDALGSLVEFQTPQEIRQKYPRGVREIHDGGAWNTIAGQPTDDSEMALALARSIVAEGAYIQDAARRAYEDWLASKPFDIGRTVYSGIRYEPDHQSQANGALMRVSPLGIFGSQFPTERVGFWAEQDAIITHPNLVCRQINNLFARALSYAIAEGPTPRDVYQTIRKWSDELGVHDSIRDAIAAAEKEPPKDFVNQQGWVLIAFQNAFFQLLHSNSLEDGVVSTVSNGGDTDTNAAIAGALLGAIHGECAIPSRWRESILSCRPHEGNPKVAHPRPELYWPVDCIKLASQLLKRAG